MEQGTNPAFLFQQNTMRDALIAGVTLNTFNNHADRVRMANLAQCVNVLQAVILTDKERMILTPTYYVMEMYSVHQNAKLLPLTIQTNKYTMGVEKLPAVSASASFDSNNITHISLVNIHPEKAQQVSLNLKGGKYNTVTAKILTAQKLRDFNSFTDAEKIKPTDFNGATLKGNTLNVNLPPFSVVVLELR